MTPRPRYYWSRSKTPKSLELIYKIIDRDLDMVIGHSTFKEAAALIALALNQTSKEPNVNSRSRSAVIGDIFLPEQFNSGWWLGGVVSPPRS